MLAGISMSFDRCSAVACQDAHCPGSMILRVLSNSLAACINAMVLDHSCLKLGAVNVREQIELYDL